MPLAEQLEAGQFQQQDDFGEGKDDRKQQQHSADKPAPVLKQVHDPAEDARLAALAETFNFEDREQHSWPEEHECAQRRGGRAAGGLTRGPGPRQRRAAARADRGLVRAQFRQPVDAPTAMAGKVL